jgi:hypothetical protein
MFDINVVGGFALIFLTSALIIWALHKFTTNLDVKNVS